MSGRCLLKVTAAGHSNSCSSAISMRSIAAHDQSMLADQGQTCRRDAEMSWIWEGEPVRRKVTSLPTSRPPSPLPQYPMTICGRASLAFLLRVGDHLFEPLHTR